MRACRVVYEQRALSDELPCALRGRRWVLSAVSRVRGGAGRQSAVRGRTAVLSSCSVGVLHGTLVIGDEREPDRDTAYTHLALPLATLFVDSMNGERKFVPMEAMSMLARAFAYSFRLMKRVISDARKQHQTVPYPPQTSQ